MHVQQLQMQNLEKNSKWVVRNLESQIIQLGGDPSLDSQKAVDVADSSTEVFQSDFESSELEDGEES